MVQKCLRGVSPLPWSPLSSAIVLKCDIEILIVYFFFKTCAFFESKRMGDEGKKGSYVVRTTKNK